MNLPNKWILDLLSRVCPKDLQDSIIGDLLEQYEINLTRRGEIISNLLFVYNGIKLMHVGIARYNKNTQSSTKAMFFNYLIVALRNLRKQKRYHLINFVGLTLGFASCSLVLLYVNHELSYDQFHHDPKNTYRVSSEVSERTWFPSIMNEYAERLMTDEFPEINQTVKFRRAPSNFAISENRRIDTRAIVTNPGSYFFEMFNFNIVEGNQQNMLVEPRSAVLTHSMAERIFGEGPYTGQIFKWDTLSLKVTGIIEDLPSNTHLAFNLLIAHDVPLVGVFAYVNLNDKANIEELEKKIADIDIGNDRYYVSKVDLQPIESIHFSPALTFELKPPGEKKYLYLFSGIALFILIISTTNYMNLSSAIYARRTKEMAVRKVLGSSKRGLSTQFLLESFLISLMTIPAVLLIIHLVLPAFSNFVEIPLQNKFLSSPSMISSLLLIVILTSLLATISPILTMRNFSALKLFRGGQLLDLHGLNLRKVLLTVQFTLLLFLGTGAFFINKQLQFIRTKDLGINKTDIVKVSNVHVLYGLDKYHTIKNISLSSPYIHGFTTGSPPGTESYGFPYKAEGHEERSDALSFGTDLDYFDVMEVEGLYGDFFERKPEDQPSISLVVNEKFVELMGWEDPIGKKVTMSPGNNGRDYSISGVFRNYHALSLHNEIVPQFIFARKRRRSASENILVKIDMQNIRQSFEAIEEAWYSVMPNSPIECAFMNEDIQKAYVQEQKAGKLSVSLSILAILLAVMGLIGLTSYMSELRTKEIGIRKVLGASTRQILLLLNKEFVLLISIATIIAGTVGYFTIAKWLEAFAYRTSVEPLIFPVAGLLIVLITFLTVSIQSGKTARKNPVESISYE